MAAALRRNVIGLLDAADLEVSVGEILAEGDDGPTLIEFKNLVLSRARTRGLAIFRLFHSRARCSCTTASCTR